MLTILPTDTCYGIAGEMSADDYNAIYRLKSRSFDKPLAILVRDFEDIKIYGKITDEQINFLKKYQYPLSILVPRTFDFPFDFETEKYQYISVRIASVCLPENLQDTLIYPLFLTSANPSGESEATDFDEAKQYFPEVSGFDGGICKNPPSDILRFTENGEVIFDRKNYSNKDHTTYT